MTRLCFVADAHLANFSQHGGPLEAGINARCRLALDVLGRATAFAKKEACDALVVCGDLFDSHRPEPPIIAAAQRALANLPTVLILGNHEMHSAAPGDNALAPMAPVAEVVEEPRVVQIGGVELLCVPFGLADAAREVPALVRKHFKRCRGKGPARLLAMHYGLSDANSPPWLLGPGEQVPAADLLAAMGERGIDWGFAGHWHRTETYSQRILDHGPAVVQLGALVPRGWQDEGTEYGRAAIWADGDTFLHRTVWFGGPRFLLARSQEEADAKVAAALAHEGGRAYLRWVVAGAEEVVEAQAAGERAMAGDPHLLAVEVERERADAAVAARAAAGAARGAGNLDEALAGFVGAMELEEGVDRAAVLRRCRAYLGAGGGR